METGVRLLLNGCLFSPGPTRSTLGATRSAPLGAELLHRREELLQFLLVQLAVAVGVEFSDDFFGHLSRIAPGSLAALGAVAGIVVRGRIVRFLPPLSKGLALGPAFLGDRFDFLEFNHSVFVHVEALEHFLRRGTTVALRAILRALLGGESAGGEQREEGDDGCAFHNDFFC